MSDQEINRILDKMEVIQKDVSKLYGQVEHFKAFLESEQGNVYYHFKEVSNDIKSLKSMILGNGKIGIATRLDRLEISEKNRVKHLFAVWTTLCGVVGKVIYDLFK